MDAHKKKLLHLVQDSFFTDFLIDQFEKENPALNRYVFLSILKKNPKFIRKTAFVQNIYLLSPGFIRLLRQTKQYEALMLHFLTPLKSWFAIFSSKKTRLVWFIWGGDYYNAFYELKKNIYQAETKNLIKKHITHKWFTREILAPTLSMIFSPVKFIARRIDFSAPVFFEEYELLRKYFKDENKYLPFSYAILEPKEISISRIRENKNILLGNNSWPTNNHLEILHLLSKFNLENKKIITPLSYGSRIYREQVVKNCPDEIKKNFYPITNFLPKEEYFSLIQSCNVAIFNYTRQQGLGNIIELLANGCKIYISENTTTWKFFNRIGIKVFSIEKDLNIENPDIFNPVSDEIILRNKIIIEKEYSRENTSAKTKRSIDTIYNG